MTEVLVDLRALDAEAGTTVPASGHIEIAPLYRYHVDEPTDGPEDYIVIPKSASVPLVDGQCSLDIPATVEDFTKGPNAYRIQEVLDSGLGHFGYFLVPDETTVDYGDLTEVTYGSLDPISPPEDAWWVSLGELQAEVDDLELNGGGVSQQYVDDAIENIELTPGPKGDDGADGADGYNGTLDTWQYFPTTTTPGYGQVSTGVPTPINSTMLYLNRTSSTGQGFGGIVRLLTTGSTLSIQSNANPDAWIVYTTTDEFTIVGDVLSVPVEVSENGPAPATGWESVSILFSKRAAPGPAGEDGQGWTGGSYDEQTGVVTFTSDDGLGFSTGDLRGADASNFVILGPEDPVGTDPNVVYIRRP